MKFGPATRYTLRRNTASIMITTAVIFLEYWHQWLFTIDCAAATGRFYEIRLRENIIWGGILLNFLLHLTQC